MAHIQPCWIFFCLSVCLVLYALLYYVDVVVKSNFFYSRTISHLSGFVSSSKFICIKAGMVDGGVGRAFSLTLEGSSQAIDLGLNEAKP